MDHGTGAMVSLLSKLSELLKEEYDLQKGVKKDVEFLRSELTSIHAALRVVAEVPWDQLEEQVRIWADDVRELSYVMEDAVDSFLVRVEDPDPVAKPEKKVNRLKQKIADLFAKGKARHGIGNQIREIKEKVSQVADRRDRYKIHRYEIDGAVADPVAPTKIDSRVLDLYKEVTELVGIDGERDEELIKLLDQEPKSKLKVVSVVGSGGLGKTTLVNAVYNKIKSGYDSSAFVPVGQNANVKKVFRDILFDLKYIGDNLQVMDVRQLIDQVRKLLHNKRYLIVIDDIWDESLWKYIECVSPNTNEHGSRVITTTRIVNVAKACCSQRDGLIFHMKPLTDQDSERLFHKRIFPAGRECPHEFEKLSQDILKKCGGVPLAIITIASLLASDGKIKPMNAWDQLLKSMGHGLTNIGSGVEEMHKILSLSYYDLPSYLKSCLLYLSIYPEDHRIERDELIWRWIAENLICEQRESGLFELGESYFEDLINRSLIQPIFDDKSGKVLGCRVHDMVLDLICSLSRKQNFVTIWDGTKDSMPSPRIAHRLSLQKDNKKNDEAKSSSMSISQVRSITVFPSASDLMPSFSSFDVLRVLDLSGCDIGDSNHLSLRDVGHLLQLRYLGLRDASIYELPAEIGKLQFLQVLDISGDNFIYEPLSIVCKLRRLMCLKVSGLNIPDGFGDLTSMEVVTGMTVYPGNSKSIKELFGLTKLWKLEILVNVLGSELEEAFVEYLGNLKNIQTLKITGLFEALDLLGERWEPPHHLRTFDLYGLSSNRHCVRVPAWVKRNPMLYSDLSEFSMSIYKLHQEDMKMLGRLPALRSFELYSQQRDPLITIDGFPLVVYFRLSSFAKQQIMFQPGALPRAEQVTFDSLITMGDADIDFDDFGLRYLPSLQSGHVIASCPKATRDKVEALLFQSLRAHPNDPISFSLKFIN